MSTWLSWSEVTQENHSKANCYWKLFPFQWYLSVKSSKYSQNCWILFNLIQYTIINLLQCEIINILSMFISILLLPNYLYKFLFISHTYFKFYFTKAVDQFQYPQIQSILMNPYIYSVLNPCYLDDFERSKEKERSI